MGEKILNFGEPIISIGNEILQGVTSSDFNGVESEEDLSLDCETIPTIYWQQEFEILGCIFY